MQVREDEEVTASSSTETSATCPVSSAALDLQSLPEDEGGAWIFGYGSLIWRPSFPYAHSVQGYVRGYKRRFWQGSTDHRGVPGAPGRVVTLIRVDDPNKEVITWGIAYYIAPDKKEEVLSYLDYREKGGYTREFVDVFTKGEPHRPAISGALLYRATEENPEFLGRAPVRQLAAHIYKSVGPSGHNVEYLLNLVKAIRQMDIHDRHLFSLERHVLTLMQQEKEDSEDAAVLQQ